MQTNRYFPYKFQKFVIIPLAFFCLLSTSDTFSQDFWEQTNDLTSFTVLSLTVAPNGNIFAGTENNSIFISINGGESWTPAGTGLPDTTIQSLISNSIGNIFAGTEVGVYYSTSNGQNWDPRATVLNNLPVTPSVNSFVINSSGNIFAGTSEHGVFRSTDGSGFWFDVNTDLPSVQISSIGSNSIGEVIASTVGGVFLRNISTNLWETIDSGLENTTVHSFTMNLSEHIFAGGESASASIHRSIDNGRNWTPMSVGLQSQFVTSIIINSSGHIYAGTDDNGVFRSLNNGNNWEPVNSGLSNLSVKSLVINSSGEILSGTGGSGVFRSVQSTLVPFAITEAAGNIGVASAMLRGTVNPNSLSTQHYHYF